MSSVPRLVYLASNLQDNTPAIPRPFSRFIPQLELVEAAKAGLHAASITTNSPLSQLKQVANLGSEGFNEKDITPQTFRLAVADLLMASPLLEELPFPDRLKTMGSLDKWVHSRQQSMFEYQEVDLGEVGEVEPIKYTQCGFEPLDLVTGSAEGMGMYPSLVVYVAKPGTGKTSSMLTTAADIKKKDPSIRILFFEIEIPMKLMLGRAKPLIDSGIFGKGDKIYAGSMTIEEIEQKCHDSAEDAGNTNQIVLIDSPDSMTGGGDENGRRFALEHIYRKAIAIKQYSQYVFLASQPKKSDRDVLYLEDLAECWAKTWYPDLILGIWKTGNLLNMKSLKNRFGVPGKLVKYGYDYANLKTTEYLMDNSDDF